MKRAMFRVILLSLVGIGVVITLVATGVSNDDFLLSSRSTITAILRPSKLVSRAALVGFCLVGVWSCFARTPRKAMLRFAVFLACMLMTFYAHRSIALSLTDRRIVEYFGPFEIRELTFDGEQSVWFTRVDNGRFDLKLISNTGEEESFSWGVFPGRIPDESRKYLLEEIQGNSR